MLWNTDYLELSVPDPIQALNESLQQYPLCDRNQGLRRIHSPCVVPPSGKCQCQSAQHQQQLGPTVMLVQRGSLSVMFFNSWLLSSTFDRKGRCCKTFCIEDLSLPTPSASMEGLQQFSPQQQTDVIAECILKFPFKRIYLCMYNSALDQKVKVFVLFVLLSTTPKHPTPQRKQQQARACEESGHANIT